MHKWCNFDYALCKAVISAAIPRKTTGKPLVFRTDTFFLMNQQLKSKLGKLSVRVSAHTDKNQ